MEQKEIYQYLSMYLPHGLKSYQYYDGLDLIRDVTNTNILSFVDRDTQALPLLYGIDTMTEEILYNQKEIIPVNKIAKAEGRNFEFKFYDKNIGWGFVDRNNNSGIISFLNINARQWDFIEVIAAVKMKIDIFGLIEKGYAKEVRNIDNNPY